MNRTVPDEGYVLCVDCGGAGTCMLCEGDGRVDGRVCGLCIGRRFCRYCQGSGQVRPRFSPGKPQGQLRARSADECRLYMELHPHECGEYAFPTRSRIEKSNDGLLAIYEAECPRCHKPRRLEFLLDSELPPAIGGAKPSAIIDPGEFLHIADDKAKRVPSAGVGLTLEQLERGREQLSIAAAAIEEVLKFIPADKTMPPATSFTSEIGIDVLRKEPGRFERPRLQAVLDTYRKGLDEYQLAIARLKAPLTDEDRALAATWRADIEARMQKRAKEGPPPRKLPADSPIFKKWEADPFPGGVDAEEAIQQPLDPAEKERRDVKAFVDMLNNQDPQTRVAALTALSGRPRADERLLGACERLLDDRSITLLTIPYTFGEVRWVAAEAVAALRGLMGRSEVVVIEDAFPPISDGRVGKLATDAGVSPSAKGGIEGQIETLERIAAAGKLPRRRVEVSPFLPPVR